MRSASLLLSAGIVVFAAAWTHPQVQAVTRTVTIDFACTGQGATISVSPWRVSLPTRNDEIRWEVRTTGLDSVAIAPKFVARWPFTVNPPLNARGNRPAVARGIPNSVPGGRYQYNITGICNRTGAPPDTVIIDPDMIIPPIGVAPGPGE